MSICHEMIYMASENECMEDTICSKESKPLSRQEVCRDVIRMAFEVSENCLEEGERYDRD